MFTIPAIVSTPSTTDKQWYPRCLWRTHFNVLGSLLFDLYFCQSFAWSFQSILWDCWCRYDIHLPGTVLICMWEYYAYILIPTILRTAAVLELSPVPEGLENARTSVPFSKKHLLAAKARQLLVALVCNNDIYRSHFVLCLSLANILRPTAFFENSSPRRNIPEFYRERCRSQKMVGI